VAEIGGTGGNILVGEHGQAAHLLVNAGVVGLALFALALVSLIAQKHWTPTRTVALGFLLAASAEFLTEPGWGLNTRTFDFVAIMFAIGSFVNQVPQPQVVKRRVGMMGYLLERPASDRPNGAPAGSKEERPREQYPT